MIKDELVPIKCPSIMPKKLGAEDPNSSSSSEPFSYLNYWYPNCVYPEIFILKFFKFCH